MFLKVFLSSVVETCAGVAYIDLFEIYPKMAEEGSPWQLWFEKLEQRCGYLLTSGQWTDCTFVVGSESNQVEIQAHKLVLAMTSPVFEAMFFGGLSDLNNLTIPIPDVQPEAFRALLQ